MPVRPKKHAKKKTQVGLTGATGSAHAIRPYVYQPPVSKKKEQEFEIPDIGMAFKKTRNILKRAQAQEPVVKPPKKKVKRK